MRNVSSLHSEKRLPLESRFAIHSKFEHLLSQIVDVAREIRLKSLSFLGN